MIVIKFSQRCSKRKPRECLPRIEECEVQSNPNFLKIIVTGDESWGATDTIRNQSKHIARGKHEIATPQEFHNCFETWQKRWDKCLYAHGQYFEEN
ncbi:hypothetical protein TNCV_892191 [Trichonephila clavipes]|nr:hypothetical protein TNCV_892191 [Trichonephila clavipes]